MSSSEGALRVLILVAACLWPRAAAQAQAPITGLVLGDAVEGAVDAVDDDDLLRFAGLAGEVVSFRLSRAPGSALEPTLLLRPADTTLELVTAGKGEAVARIDAYTLPSTGVYELVVSGRKLTTGGWRLKTRARLPASRAKVGPQGAVAVPGDYVFGFDGRPGYELVGSVRASRAGVVEDPSLQTPDGLGPLAPFTRRRGRAVRLTGVPLSSVGVHALQVPARGEGSLRTGLRLRRERGRGRSLAEARVGEDGPGTRSSVFAALHALGGAVHRLDLGGAGLVDEGGLTVTVSDGWLALDGVFGESLDPQEGGASSRDDRQRLTGRLALEVTATGDASFDGVVPLGDLAVALAGADQPGGGDPYTPGLTAAFSATLSISTEGAGTVVVVLELAQDLDAAFAFDGESVAEGGSRREDVSLRLLPPASEDAYGVELSFAPGVTVTRALGDASLGAGAELSVEAARVSEATVARGEGRVGLRATLQPVEPLPTLIVLPDVPVLDAPDLFELRQAVGALVADTLDGCPSGSLGQLLLQRQGPGAGFTTIEERPLTGQGELRFEGLGDGAWRLVASIDADVVVAPGESATLEVSLPEDGGPSSIEALASTFTLSCACDTCSVPDLRLASASLSPSAALVYEADTMLDVSFDVRNASPGDVLTGFAVDVYLSAGGPTDPLQVVALLANVTLGPLPAGQTVSTDLLAPLPSGLDCGEYSLWVRIDPADVVEEADEGDNLAAAGSSLLIDGCNPTGTVRFVAASSELGEAAGSVDVGIELELPGGALGEDLWVEVQAVDGTAGEGSDVEVFGVQQLVFPAGTVSGATAEVTVTALDDGDDEPDETFVLGLSVSAGPGQVDDAGATHTVTVLDDDLPIPDVFISFVASTSAPAEDAGEHEVGLLLSVSSGTLPAAVSVEVARLGTGTATAGVDFDYDGEVVVFPAGSADGAVGATTLTLFEDVTVEDDETIVLELQNATGLAKITVPNGHVVTIVDDDMGAAGGSFATVQSVSSNGERPIGLVAGDWNLDGGPDLAVANLGAAGVNESFTLVFNNNGTFIGSNAQEVSTSVAKPTSVARGDLNGDGVDDLVGVGQTDDDILLLFGDGANFVVQPSFTSPHTKWRTVTGDLDADGDVDFAVADGGSGAVVYLNDGTGLDYAVLPAAGSGSNVQVVALGSVDSVNDDLPDLVLCETNSDSVTVLRNTGGGAFVQGTSFGGLDTPVSVAVGFLDDDPFLDFAVAQNAGSEVALIYGDGMGGALSTATIDVGATQRDVLIDDLNGDGHGDVIVLRNGSPGSIYVAFGDSLGGFPFEATAVVQNGPRQLALADVSKDGKLDVVVVNLSSNTVSVAIQD